MDNTLPPSHLDGFDSGKPQSITTANDYAERARQKKDELLVAAFTGLAEAMFDSIDEFIQSNSDMAINAHLSNDLFNTNTYSIEIEPSIILRIQNEFFALLNANLKEYFSETPETESEEQIASTKTQLTGNKEGISKIMQETVRLFMDKGWIVEVTYNEKSGFFKTLKLSTPPPTVEKVQKSIISRMFEALKNRF
ncbi:hypothetical protein K2X92_05880 [Candidatus Gracilibacteria bacterium]|nr:hypothetical protein [Candidatus Gracilibacteria bacterium]